MKDLNKVIMPFGKYVGEYVGDLPDHYVEFLLEQVWIDSWPEVKEALENRVK